MKKHRLIRIILLLMIFHLSALSVKLTPAERRKNWRITRVSSDKVICFALYTVHNNILKLTAQLYRLPKEADRTVRLEIEQNGKWEKIAETNVIERGWTAPFRIENWDSTKDHKYRVAHGTNAFYTGTIRKDPINKKEIKVAAFTGNSSGDRRLKPDIIANIKAQDPDLLFFSGDQVYDHTQHFAAWLLFGRQFGDIIKDRPTICIPDDHDVGHGNLWGDEGRLCGKDDQDGGYKKKLKYIDEVQRAQTSHLPDPYDPTPIQRDISVYYTSLNVGGIDFAIVEDRKFKTGPKRVLPDPRPGKDDLKAWDVPEAKILGERQLKFLKEWAADWKKAEMKCVLSQTVFACAHHGRQGKARQIMDLDTNGWPQSGRNRALAIMRKAFALHICGDQHLATVIHHGIDDWNDAGYSFCVQSIVNFWPRYWDDTAEPEKKINGVLPALGEFYDNFGNKITMLAYANPDRGIPNMKHKIDPEKPKSGADGYGLVRFNKETRKITIECWPRLVDVTSEDAQQYPGWPITINQEDNYARKAKAYLPKLNIAGEDDPVIQIIDESNNEIVYTLRINGNSYQPKVFKKGLYTIKVGEGDNIEIVKNLKAEKLINDEILDITLQP